MVVSDKMIRGTLRSFVSEINASIVHHISVKNIDRVSETSGTGKPDLSFSLLSLRFRRLLVVEMIEIRSGLAFLLFRIDVKHANLEVTKLFWNCKLAKLHLSSVF